MSTPTLTPEDLILIDLEVDDVLRCEKCGGDAEWVLIKICVCGSHCYRCTACKERTRERVQSWWACHCKVCRHEFRGNPKITLEQVFKVVQL